MRKIPILLYHDFYVPNDASKDNFAVAREDFEEQMKYLSENRFEGISLERFAMHLASPAGTGGARAASRSKIVLTFDDDDVSHHDFVLPLLRGMGFSGTFFVTVNEVGKDRQMDWGMIRDLATRGLSYLLILIAQAVFYGVALAWYALERSRAELRGILRAIYVPYEFCVLNAAAVAALYRYLSGGMDVRWQK